LTATLPPQDWPENGIMWPVPYDGSSFTITIRPSGLNVVPEPSSMLLLLTGVILLTGLFLKEKLFKS